jgi:hypothetical protein
LKCQNSRKFTKGGKKLFTTKNIKIKIAGNPRASWVRPIHEFIE